MEKERFSLPGWIIKGPYGASKKAYRVVSAATDLTISTAFSEADACLIAEAPNMFALLKEFVKQHAMSTIEGEPNCEEWPCADCQAAHALIQRVLGEEK